MAGARKRLLLVGAGRWGKIFLRNLHGHPRAWAAGLVTSQERGALPLLEEQAVIHRDFHAALAEHWDGVILVSPPEAHAGQVEACLARGISVLVEKPLTLGLAAAERLELVAAASASPVLVDHVLLFHPAYEWLKKHLAGRVSAIRRISSAGGSLGPFRRAYSPLWDYGAHDLSLALDLLEEEPLRIEATASELAEVEGGRAGTYEVRMAFPGGAAAGFRVSNRSPEKFRWLEVETAEERFRLEDFPAPRLRRTDLATGEATEIPLPAWKPLENLLAVFCDGIEGRVDPRFGLALGVKVVRALERCEAALG